MTLADVLKAWRQETGLTVREAALRIGVPVDALRGFESDTLLPVADQIPPLCHALSLPAHRCLRHVAATARVILQEALEASPVRALAARHLDDTVTDAPVAELPVALQAAILRRGETVDGALSHWRQEPQRHRDVWVAAVVADLELEGEDAWPAP